MIITYVAVWYELPFASEDFFPQKILKNDIGSLLQKKNCHHRLYVSVISYFHSAVQMLCFDVTMDVVLAWHKLFGVLLALIFIFWPLL